MSKINILITGEQASGKTRFIREIMLPKIESLNPQLVGTLVIKEEGNPAESYVFGGSIDIHVSTRQSK